MKTLLTPALIFALLCTNLSATETMQQESQKPNKKVRVHTIMHSHTESIGVINDWINENGHSLTQSRPYQGDKLPSPDEFDFLIIMGGPQSSLEAKKYPYLQREISCIKDSVSNNKHVLGFCLGAQLIGMALGSEPARSPVREIGVFPITLTEAGQQDPLFFDCPPSFDVIHFHRDMPGIPEGATLLASSKGCPCQAVRYGERVYGLQFHMESSHHDMEVLHETYASYIEPGPYMQTAKEMTQPNYFPIHAKLKNALNRLIAL